LFAAVVALVPMLAAPELIHALRWPWPVVILAIAAVAMGGLWAVVTQPQHRLYLAVLQGFSPTDRHRAVDAIRRGGVPEDPAVLGAAIRLSRLSGPRKGLAKQQLIFTVLAIVAWIVLAVLAFMRGDLRQGVFWLVVSVIVGAATVRDRRRRERIQRNVGALRAAAAQLPGGLESGHTENGELEASLRRATRIWGVGAVVIIVGAVALTYFLARTSPDCRVGRSVITYINDHKDLMDAKLITTGGPPIAQYQAWSEQLRQYANQMSDASVATHADKISDLSAQAVTVVRDARAGAAAGQQQAYLALTESITDEMWAIVDVCRFSVQRGR
jgi:hypothetical protein